MSTLQVEGIRNAAASSDAITLATNGSASANLSNYGRKNWIVNGGFEVHQRGNITHAYSYCGDRFQHRTGSNAAIAQSNTVPAGFAKSMSLTASSGTLSLAWNTVLEAGNSLEGTAISNVFSNNSKWTVSIWATRVPKVRVDFTDGFGPTNPQSIVAYTTMTSTGETSNGFTRYKHTFDIGSVNPVGTSKGLHIGWQLATAAADVKFTGAQLEKGEYCGPYDHLPYGDELLRCQRYYNRVFDMNGQSGEKPISLAVYENGSTLTTIFNFLEMRTIPSLEITSGSNKFMIRRQDGSDNFDTMSMRYGTRTTAELTINSNVSGNSGIVGMLRGADTDVYVAFNAEFG
jgi:hypothetical protein